MEFMPENAPAVVLGFLFTCFLLLVAGVILVHGLAVGRRSRAWKAVVGAVVVLGVYLGILLTASFASGEKVLAPGEQKYFCEIDCHLAYSVLNVATTKSLGSPSNQKTAEGTYYVVTVKTWFDERTISNRRARNMPLTPNPRSVAVVDESGREYIPSPDGQKALERAQGKSIPFSRLIRPGESYTTDLVFDLPSGIRNARLFITTADWPTRLIIGHENSPFHKKIFFQLGPQSERVTSMNVMTK